MYKNGLFYGNDGEDYIDGKGGNVTKGEKKPTEIVMKID